MKDNEILWEQTLEAGSAWIFMGMEITFFVFVLMATIYNLSQMYKNGIRLDNEFFWELVEIGLYHVLYIYTKVNQLFVASTLQYQVTSNALIYNWGVKKKTSVEIPFSDVMAINLVEYNNSDLSTIYVLTNSDYKIHKLDFDNNDPRHTYTLEKIEKGPAVYQLLMKRWNLAKGLQLENA